MKFGGNVYSNFSNASGSKDFDYKRDVLLDEIARLIETDRSAVILILKDAGYKVDTKSSKKEVIKKVSHALHNNKQFQLDISKEIVKANNHAEFSNADGKTKEWFSGLFSSGGSSSNSGGGGSASGAGAGAGGVVGAIAGAVGSVFDFGKSNNDKKAEEERTKQTLYNKLLGDNEKTNWLPIIVISGILIIGGIIVWRVTAKK